MRIPGYSCPLCAGHAENPFRPCIKCRAELLARDMAKCSSCGIDLAGCDDPCPECRGREVLPDEVAAIGPWCGLLREWLSVFKYGGDSRMGAYLAELCCGVLEHRWPGIPVVPVPPRPVRIFREGFDPVGCIANYMTRDGVIVEKLLRRRGRHTQKSLNREQRLQSDALDYRLRRASQRLDGELVLFDDVSTTGATLNRCTEILKEAGASRVSALVICRD